MDPERTGGGGETNLLEKLQRAKQRKKELTESMSRPRTDRPMLLQMNAEAVAKEKARRDALARVAQTLSGGEAGQFREFRKSGGLDGILDDDEQAAIADKFEDDEFDD